MDHRDRPTTTVIGAGRLSRAFLPLMAAAGYPIAAVFARRPAAARAACRGIAGARATTNLASAADNARLVLIAVPDRAIEDVAERLARLPALDWKRRVVLHHAGALGCEPLAPLARAGAAIGLLHPMQCLGKGTQARTVLPGSSARIEGDRAARRVATRLARDLGLLPLRFPHDLGPDERSAYHAAGGLLANDLVALTSLALELMESTGLDRRAALRALSALARGTLEQIERGGPAAALTGPVPRGDVETIRKHLRRLKKLSAEDAELHRLLSRRLARVAADLGELSPRELERLLRATGPAALRGL